MTVILYDNRQQKPISPDDYKWYDICGNKIRKRLRLYIEKDRWKVGDIIVTFKYRVCKILSHNNHFGSVSIHTDEGSDYCPEQCFVANKKDIAEYKKVWKIKPKRGSCYRDIPVEKDL